MSDSPARITFRDIAREAGVSSATVSLALRNSSQISLTVREKIRKITERMGYVPNPLLSAYQASVRAAKPAKFQAVLGWINDSPEEDAWAKPWLRPLLEGARARAAILGYQLDEIWVPDIKKEAPSENFKRWDRILRARGIHGVILPLMNRRQHMLLPWQKYSVVCVGKHHTAIEESAIQIPECSQHHRVSSDHFFNTHLAIRRLRESGCRRIGLVLSDFLDRESDHACCAIFLQSCTKWPRKECLPVLISDSGSKIRDWAARYRPDAVICGHPEVRKHIESAGLRAPADVRLVHLNIAPDVADWTGIDRRWPLLGSAAIDLLSAHMLRNEQGEPLYAKEMSIEGVWVEGKT